MIPTMPSALEQESISIIAKVTNTCGFSPLCEVRVGQIVTLTRRDTRDGSVAPAERGMWGLIGVHYQIIEETQETESMMTNNTLVLGDTYTLTNRRHGVDAGTEVTFVDRDCDNDPVFECTVRGRRTRFYIPQNRVDAYIARANIASLENKWIAWNNVGSELANSEAEAKRKAEAMAKRWDRPAYIAKATNSVQKQDVVWAK